MTNTDAMSKPSAPMLTTTSAAERRVSGGRGSAGSRMSEGDVNALLAERVMGRRLVSLADITDDEIVAQCKPGAIPGVYIDDDRTPMSDPDHWNPGGAKGNGQAYVLFEAWAVRHGYVVRHSITPGSRHAVCLSFFGKDSWLVIGDTFGEAVVEASLLALGVTP